MEFEIEMNNDVYDEIFVLMGNIEKLNGGSEIGGWLLGDWTITDDKASLLLDEFIIPKQEVSSTEVDISPESMADTLKEIGAEKCNRIKAHWHIHPFGKGNTDWSGVDETKIKDFMDPAKGREVFVFLLSSEDKIKARIEMNIKGEVFGKTFYIRKSFDDMEVLKHDNIENTEILAKLKSRIDSKVEKTKYVNWKYPSATTQKKLVNNVGLWEVGIIDKKVHLHMDNELWEFIISTEMGSNSLTKPDKKRYKAGRVKLRYDIKEDNLETVAETLTEEMEAIEDVWNQQVQYNAGFYGYDLSRY